MKTKLIKVISVVLFLFNNTTIQAQILDPVKWSFAVKQINDNEAELQCIATMEKGWHVYSQYIDEGGPIPTSFHFTPSNTYEKLGPVKEEGKVEQAYDQNFEMNLKWFSNKVIFSQKIKILRQDTFNITGHLEFMCCNDEQCLPPKEVDFNFLIYATVIESSIETVEAAQEVKEIIADNKPLSVNTEPSNSSLWYFFFFSLLAGFAAVLTPCVFPMIPMTVTFFMQGSENRYNAIVKALVYGFSIIFIYTAIGLIVAVTLGPDFINWLSTHWLPNLFFFTLFVVFSASFFGMFEIVLPSWLVNTSDKQADKGGIIGAFFMALTLVLVSFSCTAPLVGGLLVEAATGEVLKPIAGMFGFSLAFAFPFTLLAFFPSWLSKLPKSGGWLNSVKVVLGFVILALGMKFLITPDQSYHWGILSREIYLSIWIVIFSLMGFYLLGKIKFSHDSELSYISVPRLLLSIATFSFVVYLFTGLLGSPLKAISGLLPKAAQTSNLITTAIPNRSSANTPDNYTGICEPSKYSDFLYFPLGLQGYFDYQQGLACAKKLNKPIFLDFNGHGCANCKDMEAKIWSNPEVLQRLQNDFVIIALYVDDKFELPENEWITSSYDGKEKKTMGKINSDFQITRYKINSQPYYVILDHNENILVTPVGRVDAESFITFLDKGKATFAKTNQTTDN